jgi:hypothetical protein
VARQAGPLFDLGITSVGRATHIKRAGSPARCKYIALIPTFDRDLFDCAGRGYREIAGTETGGEAEVIGLNAGAGLNESDAFGFDCRVSSEWIPTAVVKLRKVLGSAAGEIDSYV